MFDLVLAMVPHYHTLANNTSQRDQYTICSRNGHFVTSYPEILPQEVRQIDELVVQVVWLAGTSGVYGSLAQQLTQQLASQKCVNFTVCGIPLEVLPSLDECRKKPLLSPKVLKRVPFSRTLSIRPHISVCEILYHLAHGGNTDILYDITGMFIFPAAHRLKGDDPWYLGCTWDGEPREIPPLYLQPAADLNDANMPVSLTSEIVKDKREESDIYGRGQRRRLSEAYAHAMASRPQHARRTQTMQGSRRDSARGSTQREGRGGRHVNAGHSSNSSRARPAPSTQAHSSRAWDWVNEPSDTTIDDGQGAYLWSRTSDRDSDEPDFSAFDEEYEDLPEDTDNIEHDTSVHANATGTVTYPDTFPGLTYPSYLRDHTMSDDEGTEAQGDNNMDLSDNDTSPQCITGISMVSQTQLQVPVPRASLPDAVMLEQVTRLSTRYEKLKDDLCREECNFKCIEMKLGTNFIDLDLQYQLEASQRIMVSKRASMKDMERRIRESCQILQLPAEDFVYFEDVT
jgi:hypothetical protein